MDKGSQHLLTIERMPQGGYLIWPFAAPSDFRYPIFACTTINEALVFLRDMIHPIPMQQGQPEDVA